MNTSPIPKVMWPRKVTQVPKEIFVRQDIYEEELRRIFYGPEWMPVAHDSELPNPGDFKTCYVGEAPLLITRDSKGKVHAFYNSCSHRGTQLETRAYGNRKIFSCPYHR